MNGAPFLVPRERLTAVIRSGYAPHLRPIVEACRDFGCAWASVPQRAGPFRIPSDRPAIVVIGDDTEQPLGPAGFHQKSVRQFAARCGLAVVVSCEPLFACYAAAATCVVLHRRDALLIESQPQFESDWIALVQAANPDIGLIVGAVRPEGGVH